ncbi:CHAT domain-containing protein, partial [Nonomuraea sp. NPDC004297]
ALLPRLAPRHRDRADREHGLGDMSGLAADAAAAAIAAGRPHHAVELLEQARGILFGELMSERGDLLRLHDHAPELAGRFERLRAELDAGRPYTLDLARRQERLGQDWDDLLARIRAEPGFARFLLPPPIDELRRQAGPGPVVVLNSSRHRCDALVLTSDGDRPVRLVALPALSRDDIVSQAGRLHAAITDSRGDRRRWRPAQQAVADVLAWLWDAVVAPVLTGPEPVGAGRVWWCPVAELTALPLHAAGRPGSRESALDHVVSSYTPTIRALGYARDHAGAAARDGAPVTALIVAMPETPGATRLPKAGQEAGHVAAALPGSAVLTGPEATYAAVRDGLPLHPVAHLACHGVSDLADPASSRLLLHDHAERPLTVAALSRLRIAGARLAFLSACSTTAGGDRLPDEAMHITTAFQLAGFQQVIGTLWPVNDTIAARVAEGVYAGLGGGVERAADALRDAIRGLRDAYPDQPALWAGYVHAGA